MLPSDSEPSAEGIADAMAGRTAIASIASFDLAKLIDEPSCHRSILTARCRFGSTASSA